MIKTLKQTISNIYYWIKKKLIQFKKWLVILIFGAVVVAAPLALPNVPDVALEKIQQKYEASELKDKYRLEKTAFILDAVDENAIQAEVGNKNSDEFLPELTLRKWDDEVNFKVKHRHNEKKKDLKFELDGKKIKLKGKKIETHFYEMENAYEFEIILLEKPDVNVVEFDIESKGLKFYRQPPLTEEFKNGYSEEFKKEIIVTETDVKDLEGNILIHRPIEIVNSFAVYHESKQGDYSKMGLKNYRAGIAFHIYRPKIIDNAGTEVWGELNIIDNLLTVEIPQEFLDTAVYPIRHAAGLTFGYETMGGTSSGGQLRGSYFMGAVGTATKLTAGLSGFASNKAKGGIYKQSDNNKVVGGTAEVTIGSRTWYDFDIPDTVITAQNYWLVLLSESLVAFYYNSTGNGGYQTQAYGAWPDSISMTGEDKNYSIYCTYTAGGAEARRMFLTQ